MVNKHITQKTYKIKLTVFVNATDGREASDKIDNMIFDAEQDTDLKLLSFDPPEEINPIPFRLLEK